MPREETRKMYRFIPNSLGWAEDVQDLISSGAGGSGGEISIDLSNYYTKEEINNSFSQLSTQYVKTSDTTLVRLVNENEINLQEDHYNAWFGYRDGKVTNWKFGDGTEGGLANIYVKDLYLNNQSLSDLLGDKAEDSDLTAHTSNANIHVTVSDKNKWDNTYTKVEVDNKISGLVNSAPETLNTLNALAEALGNDENFAANVATQIGLKANSSDLSTVATSGSYDDLDDKPTIPTKTSELINDSNFLTGEQDIGDLTDHISNINIHVTTADKAKWNGKQDALSEEQLNNIDDVVNKANLTDVLPTGSYIQFAGLQAPEGFLVCNGGAISRTIYSKLFAVIGTTYGSGDGSTTFNLPNLIDRFLQGSSTSGTVRNAGLPNITGRFFPRVYGDYAQSQSEGAFSGSSSSGNEGIYYGSSEGSASIYFNASRSNSIYGNSTTVQPPALTCLICIKY